MKHGLLRVRQEPNVLESGEIGESFDYRHVPEMWNDEARRALIDDETRRELIDIEAHALINDEADALLFDRILDSTK